MEAQQNEANKLAAIELAGKIFRVVVDPKFKQFDPDVRHKTLVNKYPHFANAYPIVLRWMARDLKYNENAFREFFNYLTKFPGKGMEGFIDTQAHYSKFLYIEDHKSQKKHVNYKAATMLYQREYNSMMSWYKKIQNEEKQVKNEFEEESAENLKQKQHELLEFINSAEADKMSFETLDSLDEEVLRHSLGLPPKNAPTSFADIDVTKLGPEEMQALNNGLHDFIREKQKLIISLGGVPQEPPDSSNLHEDHKNMLAIVEIYDKQISELQKNKQPKQRKPAQPKKSP